MLAPPTYHPIKAARLLYSLPSALLRGPIYLIFVILLIGLVYSFWAKQDIIVTAPLVLQKDSTTLQATGGGVVGGLFVRPNSRVQAGDLLTLVNEKLTPLDNAHREALESQLFELQKERDKLTSEYESKLAQLQFDLDDLINNRDAHIQRLEGQIGILRTQLAAANNAKAAAEKSRATASDQYARTEKLYQEHNATITQLEQAREKLIAANRLVFDMTSQSSQITISLRTAEADLRQYRDLSGAEKTRQDMAQTRTRRERDLKRLAEQMQRIAERLQEAVENPGVKRDREANAAYTSLFDGVITEVHVYPGSVITAGAPLVTVVPDTALLEGHAFVENQDIGQLKRGQPAQIKYFAYPYQEYGIAKGLISSIATTPSGLPGKESQYLVTIALHSDTIHMRGGRPKQLEMGLEGMAEMKTGERRFVEILFSPLSKFLAPKEDSL